MLRRPPQHRADAPIVFVHPEDDAWDLDRIQREQNEMDNPSEHPVARYWGGFTRYDLDAEGTVGNDVVAVRDYLDEAKATRWHLRRLHPLDYLEISGQWKSAIRNGTSHDPAFLRCASIGIQKVENGPELEGVGGKGKRLTEGDIETLATCSHRGPELILDIGQAIFQANMPLTADEKKA